MLPSVAGTLSERYALIDTSAVIALFDPADQFHSAAVAFFGAAIVPDLLWLTMNATAHELFTRVRYRDTLPTALRHFDYLREARFGLVEFGKDDEATARHLLGKYRDQSFSFHDALCAAVMLRVGVYKIFTFDRDFWTLGFEVMPGVTA